MGVLRGLMGFRKCRKRKKCEKYRAHSDPKALLLLYEIIMLKIKDRGQGVKCYRLQYIISYD